MIKNTDFKEKQEIVNSILSYNEDNIQNSENTYKEELPLEEKNPESTESNLNDEINENQEKSEQQDSTQEETFGETTNIETKDANTTNCLALTIQKDHKLVAVKNVVIRSIRMTWKVVVSTVALTIFKLFS